MNRRAALVTAGATGALAILLGAFGAHALKSLLEVHHAREIWTTAVLYHLVHSVALLRSADHLPSALGSFLCLALGILIFSGSLYLLALTGISWLGAVTPVGGLLLIAGWILVMARPPGKSEFGSESGR
jgi:uncharacterized membrane protein YgdD (TMEM256/DUF423 family)